MQLKAVLLNRVHVDREKVVVCRVAAVAIVDRETADRASSMRRLRHIAGAGCDWTCTFNNFQNFPNPAGFEGMRPCEVLRDICTGVAAAMFSAEDHVKGTQHF